MAQRSHLASVSFSFDRDSNLWVAHHVAVRADCVRYGPGSTVLDMGQQ